MNAWRNPVYPILVVRTLQASALALGLHVLLHWPLRGPHALGLFFTPTLCLYFVFVFVAPWSWGLPIRTRLSRHVEGVALTFDDGPSPETTPRLLDILAAYDVRATFFVLGESVSRHPDLLRRIVEEGHEVGVHGWRHQPFVLLSWGEVGEEVRKTREAVREACPRADTLTWLRPPHGFKTLSLPLVAGRHGGRLVTWSVNARDYKAREAGAIAQNVLAAARPRAIILLHDGPRNAATVEAMPDILAGLKARRCPCVFLGAGPSVRGRSAMQQTHVPRVGRPDHRERVGNDDQAAE